MSVSRRQPGRIKPPTASKPLEAFLLNYTWLKCLCHQTSKDHAPAQRSGGGTHTLISLVCVSPSNYYQLNSLGGLEAGPPTPLFLWLKVPPRAWRLLGGLEVLGARVPPL